MLDVKADKKIVVLCTSRVYDPQVYGYIRRLNDDLVKNNCALLIFSINSDQYWNEEDLSAETAIFDVIPYKSVDAVIIMDEKIKSHSVANRIIEASRSYSKPVITIDGSYEGVSRICFDYPAGFENVVRHVMERKVLKNPHMMAGFKGNIFSEERIEIFKKVVTEYGFEFNESMVSYGDFWSNPTREAMQKLIDKGNIPDAVICANDIMAINVFDVLTSNGYSVPGDVLVSGFDGYDEALLMDPKITTVSCNTSELADATVEMIKKIFESDGKMPAVERKVVPVLIPNESTGCPAYTGQTQNILSRFNNNFYRHQDDIRILYNITTSMQLANSPEQMISQLKKLVNDEKVTQSLTCVMNKNCFDRDDYFFDKYNSTVNLQDFTYVYDADNETNIVEVEVEDTLLRPDNKRFMEKVNSGYPVIFNALDYMDTLMGYVYYNYQSYDIIKYSRTANITNTISMGVGGYINSSYQRGLVEKIDKMYKKDALTGLLNRIGFQNLYDRIRSSDENYGREVTVIMSDLDGLKYINDNYGHEEGDNAIITIAKALKKSCPEDALCVRYGGDEIFAMIIGKYDIEGVMDHIKKELADYNETSEKEYMVVVSCGFASYKLDEDFDIKKALRNADKKMYEEKKQHRMEQGKAM